MFHGSPLQPVGRERRSEATGDLLSRPYARPMPSLCCGIMNDPNSYRERAQRAVQGRRGCRATSSIEDRYAILGFVIWHREADRVAELIHLAEGFAPGAVATWMSARYSREYERERNERRSVTRHPSYGLAYSHAWNEWNGNSSSADKHIPRDTSAHHADLEPPNGITFRYKLSNLRRLSN